MSGDLRARVAEWLVDMFGDSPDFALRHADDLISRVLDADPDTPTTDAPVDTDERLRNEVFEAVYNIVCDHPMWEGVEYQSSREAKIGDFCDETADAVLPLVRAQVETARRDALNEAADAWDRSDAETWTTPGDWLRGRAARGETRQP